MVHDITMLLSWSKIQCLFKGEEGEGGEVGAGANSGRGERRRKREPEEKKKKKTRKVTQPLHKKQYCNFSKIVLVLLVEY